MDSSNAQSLVNTSTYDELTRLLSSIGANGETTTYGYDLAGNPTQVTDGRGNLFKTAFDPLNRILSRTDPESHTVSYTLNPSDKLTQHTDGGGVSTTRTVDGFGEVIQEVSPDTGTTSAWYDAAGNLTKQVDGDNVETDFTYDALNRLATKTFANAASENETYTYDSTASGNYGVGRLTTLADQWGSTGYTYDAQGRVTKTVKVINGSSYTVGYAYDANGKVTKISYPSGRVVNITRATDGLISQVATAPSGGSSTTLASGVTYRPMHGPLSALTYGNGLALAHTVGQNYALIGISVTGASTATLNLTINRDNDFSIFRYIDNAGTGRDIYIDYTPSGRISAAFGPWGEYDYAYDGAGNTVERDVTPAGGSKAYTSNKLETMNNWISRSTDQTGVTKRTLYYGAGGDLVQDQRVGATTYSYTYNHHKRMTGVQVGGSYVGTYGFDALGARVWRQATSPVAVNSQYVYDTDGHLLMEQNGSTGKVGKEYVWLDDMPLAVIDYSSGTAVTYYIHTGPMDEPLAMTNAAKATVWSAYVEPFGAATVFGTASESIDLRLPGQWLTAETGALNQNGFRDYDPTLGRYIEPDPLGLEAGQNRYSYVDGDPLDYIDPKGLQSDAPPGIGHNGGPPLEGEVPEALEGLGRFAGPIAGLLGWAIPTPLNKGEDEQICRIHFGIPQNWTASTSNKGGGIKFSDPNNPNNNIRFMPGNPNSPNPAQQAPYIKYQNNGVNYNQNGNPVQNDSSDSHIPMNSYNPNAMPK